MSAERSIEMAEAALQANKPASASALYESAARELADAGRRRAAHLFLLAAWHAIPAREDRLAEEAQRIYETEGDDEKIAGVALIRAARGDARRRAWPCLAVPGTSTSPAPSTPRCGWPRSW